MDTTNDDTKEEIDQDKFDNEYNDKLNQQLELFDEMPRTTRLYYEHLFAKFSNRERVGDIALPPYNTFQLSWDIKNYDQTKEKYGDWSVSILTSFKDGYPFYLTAKLDIEKYPYSPPIVTIDVASLNEDIGGARGDWKTIATRADFLEDTGKLKLQFIYILSPVIKWFPSHQNLVF